MIQSKTRFIFGGRIIIGSGEDREYFPAVTISFANASEDQKIGEPYVKPKDHEAVHSFDFVFNMPSSLDVLLFHAARAKRMLIMQEQSFINTDADSFWE